jgi:hypothetical protein
MPTEKVRVMRYRFDIAAPRTMQVEKRIVEINAGITVSKKEASK